MKFRIITLSMVLAMTGITLETEAQDLKMGDELVANGGFETLNQLTGEPVGWHIGDPDNSADGQVVTVETEGAKEGVNYLKIVAPAEIQYGKGTVYSEPVKIPWQWIFDTDNQAYEQENYANMSFWLKPDKWFVKDFYAYPTFTIKINIGYYDISSTQDGVYRESFKTFQVSDIIKPEEMKANEWFHVEGSIKQNTGFLFLPDINKPVTIRVQFDCIPDMDEFDSSKFYSTENSIDDVHLSITEQPVSHIDGVSTSTLLPVKAEGTTLYVAANAGEQIRVYTTNGSQVATAAAVQGTTRIDNLPKGLLLVKAGKQTAKVLMK